MSAICYYPLNKTGHLLLFTHCAHIILEFFCGSVPPN